MRPVAAQTDPIAVLVTGIQAAGKSTVGRLLAERFQRGTFIDGDTIGRMWHHLRSSSHGT